MENKQANQSFVGRVKMSSSWTRVRKIASSIKNSATKMTERMDAINTAVQFVVSWFTEL